MERKERAGLRRWLLIALLAVCAVAAALWLRPRSMEELVGVPPEQVIVWELEVGQDEAEVSGDGPGPLEELAGFSFARPTPCGALTYQGEAYQLSLGWDGGQSHFFFLEDGTLWDGSWRYALTGGESARADLLQRLQAMLQPTRYEVTLPDAEPGQAVTSEDILAFCRVVSEGHAAGRETKEYAVERVEELLPECETLQDVSSFGDHLYISYQAKDGKEVWLSYTKEGLRDKVVYTSDGIQQWYEGFRAAAGDVSGIG